MSATNYVRIKDKKGFIFHKQDAIVEQVVTLVPGLYKIYDSGGMFQKIFTFDPIELKDSLIKFKSGAIGTIMEKTDNFFSTKTTRAYMDMGIAQKMGILLYGPAGTGKTCTAQLIMLEIVRKYNAICLDATGQSIHLIKEFTEKVRSVQDNPIIVFVDEAERVLRGEEDEYITFLDGTDSVSNFIFLGCTNFINRVPKRIRERRSRMKYVVEIKSLPLEVYREYINSKLPSISTKTLEKFAYLAMDGGLTIDELKHAVIDYHIEGVSIEEAIALVKEYSVSEDYNND